MWRLFRKDKQPTTHDFRLLGDSIHPQRARDVSATHRIIREYNGLPD